MKPLVLSLAAAGVLNSAGFIIDGNTTAAFAAFAATIVVTLGVVKWIDSRIESKLANHAMIEGLERRAIMQEISNLRVALGKPPLDVKQILGRRCPEPEGAQHGP